jgi:predicted phage-related endonuclease
MTKMGVRNEIPEDLAYFGHKLEPVIAQWVRDKHPEVGLVKAGFSARSVEHPWLSASPDCVADDMGLLIPIELKTSSAYSKEAWADGVPLYYETQVQTQIAVLDAPYGWLAVLHGGNSPELFRIERDQDFITNHLIPKTETFWNDHVLAKLPPEPTTSTEAIELWPGDPELTIEGGEDLLELHGAYGLLQAEQIDVGERLDGIKLELQKAMQDAVELTHNGQTLFTWKPGAGAKRFDAAALKAEHPDIHAQYMKQGEPTRTFLRKKADTK